MRLVKPYQVSSQTGPPKAAFGTMPFVFALFDHRELPSLRIHWPLATRHHHTLPPAGNWVRFAYPISPWFVLSYNLISINTRAVWLRFGAFLSPPAPSLEFHWPLTTGRWPLFSRHSSRPPPGPAGSGRDQTLPRWLLPVNRPAG